MDDKQLERNQTYHNLLVGYIEQIGSVERPADCEELAAYRDTRPGRRSRFVGSVSRGEGTWDLYLLRIETAGGFRLIKRRMGRYKSRRIAEIMAKYIAAVAEEAQAKTSETDSAAGIAWN